MGFDTVTPRIINQALPTVVKEVNVSTNPLSRGYGCYEPTMISLTLVREETPPQES